MVLVRVLEHIPTLAYIRDNIHLMCSFTRALANPGDTIGEPACLGVKKTRFCHHSFQNCGHANKEV